MMGLYDTAGISTCCLIYFWHTSKILLNFLIRNIIVSQVAIDITVIRRHIYQAVTGKIEEDNSFLALFLRFTGLTDCSGDGMTTLRCRDDAFCTCKEHTCLECFELRNIYTMH